MAGTKKDSEKEYSPNWGGKRAGQGRPKGTTGAYKEVTKNLQVAFKLTADEKKQLEERAANAGLTVSKYIHQLVFGDSPQSPE